MLKGLIICMCLCEFSTFAQKLSITVSGVAYQVKVDVTDVGSFQLQAAPSLGSPWSALTNFNALAGTSVTSQGFTTAPRQFFQVKRQTNGAAILVQPQPVGKYSGEEAKLQSGAAGSWPLTLQWYKVGTSGSVQVPGANSSSLVFNPAKVADSGAYALLASNTWGSALSSTVLVQIMAPVVTNIAGRVIHFDIQGGRPPLVTSGNYDMTCDASGFYTTTGSSAFLTDQGFWAYTKWDEVTGFIQMFQSFIYPQGTMVSKLIFETPTTGTFTLTAGTGYQIGRFTFLN
jgi:hypothetical protein